MYKSRNLQKRSRIRHSASRKLKKNRGKTRKHRKMLKKTLKNTFMRQKGGDIEVTAGPGGITGSASSRNVETVTGASKTLGLAALQEGRRTTETVATKALATSAGFAKMVSPAAIADAIIKVRHKSRQSGNTQAAQSAANTRQKRISEMGNTIKSRTQTGPAQPFGPVRPQSSGIPQSIGFRRPGTVMSGPTSSGPLRPVRTGSVRPAKAARPVRP